MGAQQTSVQADNTYQPQMGTSGGNSMGQGQDQRYQRSIQNYAKNQNSQNLGNGHPDPHTKEVPSIELSLYRAFNDYSLADTETNVYPKISKNSKRKFETHYPSVHSMNHVPQNTEYERVSKYTYGEEIDGFSRFGVLTEKYEGAYSKSKEYREFMGRIQSNYIF